MQNLQPFIDSLQKFAQKRLDFKDPPKLFLKQDQENAKDVFGKTAFYDPNEKSITIFTTGRHPKDILRSIAHELVHHCQNLRGDLSPEKCGEMGTDYAQKNDHMREMEREAYEKGNLCFRDWEDGIKVAMQQENNQLKENKKMVKISKKELKGLIGKILEARMEEEARPVPTKPEDIEKQKKARNMKYVKLEQTEELEEGGCTPKAKRDTENLEEEKGEKCCPAGTPNCPGPGKKLGEPGPHKGLSKNKELEEGDGNAKTEKYDDNPKLKGGQKNLPDKLQQGIIDASDSEETEEDKKDESKIQTPEQEQKLYESRFNKRNEEIFDKLKKLWTK